MSFCFIECFDVQNNTLTSNKSKETIRFRELHDNLMICLNKSSVNETTMCPLCMDSYVELNDYYNSISNENEKIGVCMDIVDQVSLGNFFMKRNHVFNFCVDEYNEIILE